MEGLENVTLMSAEGLYHDAFVEAVGEAGVGVYLVIPSHARRPGP